jgi:transposase
MQAYSLDLRQRIVAAVVSGGMNQKQAAQCFAVSPATVSRYVASERRGQNLAPKKPKGKPARLTSALAQCWQEYLQNHPHATIAAQQRWLQEQGVRLCRSAVHANLRRRGFTFKKSPSLPRSATPKSGTPSGRR